MGNINENTIERFMQQGPTDGNRRILERIQREGLDDPAEVADLADMMHRRIGISEYWKRVRARQKSAVNGTIWG